MGARRVFTLVNPTRSEEYSASAMLVTFTMKSRSDLLLSSTVLMPFFTFWLRISSIALMCSMISSASLPKSSRAHRKRSVAVSA